MLRILRSLPLVLALAMFMVPAAANAAPVAKKAGTAKSKTTSSKKKTTKKTTYPTVTKVSPMKAGIGDKIVIKGKTYKSGKAKNYVVFKRDGGKALFVKADKATTTQITVTVPAKLLTFFKQKSGAPQPTRFRLRVMATKLGKTYTKTGQSPLLSPTSSASGSAGDCDADGVSNAKDGDDDNDLASDTLEATAGTDACKRDSDGDGMSDGWEIQSAKDRNGGVYPKTKPSPNPLDPKDAAIDSDGDGLTNLEEYSAWATYGGNAIPLSYSGGNGASTGRGAVPAGQGYMDRDGNGFLSDLERDADGDGFPNMDETRGDLAGTTIEAARITKSQADSDPKFYDFGIFTPSYLAQAAELAQQSPLQCGGINQVPFYCTDKISGGLVDVQKVDTLDWLSPDSDGDGLRDDGDDVDHDGISNLTEYLSMMSLPFKSRKVSPLDACVPSYDNAACLLGSSDIDGDGLPNASDEDDDGDGLVDGFENGLGTNPLAWDTDGDGVSDGFEYYSARDLNNSNVPYPGKRAYPNALDKTDANSDFDGDSLTLTQEYQAWLYGSCSGHVHDATYNNCHLIFPLSYSDGTQKTDGSTSDADRDVDGDGLTNWVEANGPLSSPAWWNAWANAPGNRCNADYVESNYAGPAFSGLDFVDHDTDGDDVRDGDDDVDHDGYRNDQEQGRPLNWCSTYVSSGFSVDGVSYGRPGGTNPVARVQPFNPCKPTYSSYCHYPVPQGYYPAKEDWASPYHVDGP
ncbi:MAG TPA: hypothetical protein VK501_09015 [Baekduia sp.]|uniref:hypothetical protein n=1 Tax=Baekduia sp. TaxID=2600305 RepID=UPI002D13BAB0|nr:hypothetical protein [Baekduia sp.]HMJ34047.1 hypothetical protein [Baekduia sp.]